MRPRCLLLALPLVAALRAAPAEPASSAPSTASTPSASEAAATEFNLRALGALGDGRPHPVSEWIAKKRYKNLRDLQRDYPFVTSLEWSVDEAAFQRALHDLPPEGGTIRIPAGRYVATAHGWRIERDHVRIVGAGARDTMLSTGPKIDDGFALAPYRHVGWLDGADQACPFTPDSGSLGSASLRLREPARVADFAPGDLVFIRDGACAFEQDYGEMNEVVGTTPEGDVRLKHPLARDYTLSSLAWANELAEPLTLPNPGRTVTVAVRSGEGFHELPKSGLVTVGEALLEVVSRNTGTVTLRNPTRSPRAGGGAVTAPAADATAAAPAEPGLGFNPPPGTVLPAGTKIGKSRALLKLTRTTRGFHLQGVRVFGRRKALNISNSYESSFLDCDFVRQPDAAVRGGLSLDADDGRFADFRRCTFRGTEACNSQVARSFGNASFTDCTFVATNVVFSEFSFGGTLQRSRIQAPASLGNAVVVGFSCGDLLVADNHIVVADGPLNIFDAQTDIHSQKRNAPGLVTIRDNRVTAPPSAKVRVFRLRPDRPSKVTGNTLNNEPVDPPPAKPAP